MKNKSASQIFFYFIFALYLVFLLYVLFLKNLNPLFINFLAHGGQPQRATNFVPFLTINNYLRSMESIPVIVLNNVLGNVAIFIPLGLYLPYFRKRSGLFINFFFVVLISVAVEALQYATGLGACDVDDVILNSLGGLIGIIAYKIARWVRRV